MTVVPENLNDLWVLYHVVSPGDLISGKTVRRVGKEDGKGGERVPMHLKIRVEKVEFYEFANRLRILGKILEGPEDKVKIGAHHTFNVEVGREISIEKEAWDQYLLKLIEKAKKAAETPTIAIVAVDREEATLALVTLRTVYEIAHIRSNLSGKRYSTDKSQEHAFFAKIMEVLKDKIPPNTTIVIGGPGDTKNNLAEFLSKNGFSSVWTEDASSATISGIYEIIKRGAHSKAMEEIRVAKELSLVEEIFIRIARGQKNVAYGIERVKHAAEMGAIDILLVTDKLFRERYEAIAGILNTVEKMNGTVEIISIDHEGGERLASIGGIAALLRYDIYV